MYFSSCCIHLLPWQAAGMGGWRTPWHSVPTLDQVSGLADGVERGTELPEQGFPCWRSFGHPSPDAFQLSARKESLPVLLHKVRDGFYPRECGEPPWKVTASCGIGLSSACSGFLDFSCRATVFRLTPADSGAARFQTQLCM